MLEEKVKLSKVSIKDCAEVCKNINLRFLSFKPLKVCFELGRFFSEIKGRYEVDVFTESEAMIPENGYEYYHAIAFDFKFNDEQTEYLAKLIRTSRLNDSVINRLHRDYFYVHEKKPESFEQILETFENNNELVGDFFRTYMDVQYFPEKNSLWADDLYTGIFKGQRLLTGFYENIGRVVDFDDLECLSIESIVEGRTTRMFDELREKIPNDEYLCEKLKRKYVKSPFMRLLKGLGFEDMTIVTCGGSINELHARKTGNFKFQITERNKR